MEFSVLTFNIWDIPFWFCLNRERRMARLIDYVKKYDPDVICFQESFDVANRLEFHKQLGKSIYDAPLDYMKSRRVFWYKKFDRSGGLLTFSKFKILKSRFVRFKHHTLMAIPERVGRKGILETIVKTPLGPISIVNIHVLHGKDVLHERIRANHLKTAFNHLKDVKLATVFAGDFNEVAQDHEDNFHGLFSKIGFRDSARFIQKSQRPTLRIDNPYTTILFQIRSSGISERWDHILIRNSTRRKISVLDVRTLTQPRNPLSDHEPVMARLRIGK